jgi:hypothetical protein
MYGTDMGAVYTTASLVVETTGSSLSVIAVITPQCTHCATQHEGK